MRACRQDESVVRKLWNTTREYMQTRGLSAERPGFLHRHLNAVLFVARPVCWGLGVEGCGVGAVCEQLMRM
jgi:bacteriorhodopsin